MTLRTSSFTVLFFSIVTFLIFSSAQAGQSPSPCKKQNLTPERAKDALLEMMRSKAGKELSWFNDNISDEMAKLPVEEGKEG
jgi:hypothetical protein